MKKNKTIADFGNQFLSDRDNEGYFGSITLLEDIVSPFKLAKIRNKNVLDIGSGSGRILKNLLKFNPKTLTGLEPSKAIKIAKKNLKSKKISFLNIKAEDLEFKEKYHFIFSLGVIHHIENKEKALIKAYNALRNKGVFVIWVYGKEGNEIYLKIFDNLRKITSKIPDFILKIISNILVPITYCYGVLCYFIKLPLKNYFINVFNKLNWKYKRYTIFDQLNPSHSVYYKKEELSKLLKKVGIKKFKIYNRHNYSWTVIIEK
jgi:SAM-dependent methyltransferase